MIKKLLSWFLSLFSDSTIVVDVPDVQSSGNINTKPLYSYIFVDDVPDNIRPEILYLVGNDGYFWQAIMKCPCGCDSNLHMNLIDDYYPCWTYEISDNNEISLKPSVDRLVGCKSHFFLRGSRIVWAYSNDV